MKRLPKIEVLLTAVGLLLSLSQMSVPFIDSFKPDRVLAQSVPRIRTPQPAVSTPTPTATEWRYLWLWLLAIPVGGLLVWAIRQSSDVPVEEKDMAKVASMDPISVMNEAAAAPQVHQLVNQADPILDGQAPDPTLTESGSVAGSNHYPVSDLALPQPLEHQIQLLEERLVVDVHQRKVGEVIVRKEIETRIVEIPIRREKLIVEQVSPEFKQLAVIDLGQTEQLQAVVKTEFLPTVEAKFTSATAAMQFLQEIADQPSSGLQQVQMNIVLKDADAHAIYQHWLEHDLDKPTAAIAT